MLELREPMLSAKEPDFNKLLQKLTFPKLGSPKMDGIRAFRADNQLYSRRLKLIPNGFVQAALAGVPDGIDGELIVGKPNDMNTMQYTSSGVMSRDGEPDFKFYVFDSWALHDKGFRSRLAGVRQIVEAHGGRLKYVPHQLINSVDELMAYETRCLNAGYEGVMLRDPLGPYKHGRSTMVEQWLVAVKRFIRFEAQIVHVHEQMHNANEATVNELGRTKRSGHKANKHGKGTFGGATCRTKDGRLFRVGGGKRLTAKLRDALWAARDELPGQWLTIESLPIGVKDLPRHPRVVIEPKDAHWVSLRSLLDFDPSETSPEE